MNIKPDTKRVYLVSGHDGKLKNRACTIDRVSADTEILIFYTDKIPTANRIFVEKLAAEYGFVHLYELNNAKEFRATEYAPLVPRIIGLMETTHTPRERYLTSLKSFGREHGANIYRLIRTAV